MYGRRKILWLLVTPFCFVARCNVPRSVVDAPSSLAVPKTTALRGVAPLLLPDVDTAPFTALSFHQKYKIGEFLATPIFTCSRRTNVVLGDALGRLRMIDVTKAPPLVSLATVTAALSQSSSTASDVAAA